MLRIEGHQHKDFTLTFVTYCDECGIRTVRKMGGISELSIEQYLSSYLAENKCDKCNILFNEYKHDDIINHIIWGLDQKFIIGVIDSEETVKVQFYRGKNVNVLINVRSALPDRAGRLREIVFSYCMGPVKKCTNKKMFRNINIAIKDIVERMKER